MEVEPLRSLYVGVACLNKGVLLLAWNQIEGSRSSRGTDDVGKPRAENKLQPDWDKIWLRKTS